MDGLDWVALNNYSTRDCLPNSPKLDLLAQPEFLPKKRGVLTTLVLKLCLVQFLFALIDFTIDSLSFRLRMMLTLAILLFAETLM